MRCWLVLALLLGSAATASAQRGTPAPAAKPPQAVSEPSPDLMAQAFEVSDEICLGTYTQAPPGQPPAKCCVLCFAGDKHRIRDGVDGMPDRYIRLYYEDVIMNMAQEVRDEAAAPAAAKGKAPAAAEPEEVEEPPAVVPDAEVIAEQTKVPLAEVKRVLSVMPKEGPGGKGKKKKQGTLSSLTSLASLASPQLGGFSRGPSAR